MQKIYLAPFIGLFLAFSFTCAALAQDDEYDKVRDAVDAIRAKWDKTPDVAIVLGTGLGGLADSIDAEVAFPYEELPHFARSTVKSHEGKLICGTLEGKTVVAMQGRLHCYEGYSPKEITFPIRVMKELGAKTLIVSNACGGLNPQYKAGDVMLIEDHISFFMPNPLIGVSDERLGTNFDMCEPYSKELIERARQVAIDKGIYVQKGVYVAVPGPQFETRAEYRFLRGCGADVVGMSTVPEVMVAVHAGMRVLGLSLVTDMGLADALEPCDLDRVIKTANDAAPKVVEIVKGVVKSL